MSELVPFLKMQGAGNDFVVLDGRHRALALDAAAIRRLADRRLGIGCDQLILLRPAADADVAMRIFNPDGSEAGACGNATRCVAELLHGESGGGDFVIETIAGRLPSWRGAGGEISVDMGAPRLEWDEVPLAGPADTLHLALAAGNLSDPAALSMGNPHVTFFVDDLAAIPIATLGPVLEHDPIFPQRANIGVAQILPDGAIRLRVWERGAGLTLACGSGACAALVNAARRGRTGRSARLLLDGGELRIEWRADGHVVMTGPAALSFTGEVSL